MIAVLRQPRSRSALPNEALFLLLFLPLAVVAHDRAERGVETRNWKNRGSCEEEIGRRMETIGRVLFSLSNLCTIFVIETFRGRKCDALVEVFFFSFLHFVLLSKKSKFRYASCSNETILFSRRERKKGEGKKIAKSPSTVGSWTGIVELHLTWGGESLENLFVALFRVHSGIPRRAHACI